MHYPSNFKQMALAILFCISGNLQAATIVEEAFPGAEIDPELQPLIREFISLADRARITLPLSQHITKVQFVPHDQMPRQDMTTDVLMALTLINTKTRDAEILLSDKLKTSPIEKKMLLFHELVHAAGYDHPTSKCNWAETGCGIMGQSPFAFKPMTEEQAEFVINKSFKSHYMARLPHIKL